MKKKAALIIHGIGEQKEFDTLNEFTDGFFQAIRRKIQSARSINTVSCEFRFGSRGKVDGRYLEDAGFATIKLPDCYIDLYEGYWARLSTIPRFRQIIAWIFSTLIRKLWDTIRSIFTFKFKEFFRSLFIVGIGIIFLLLLLGIYLVPFLPLFPLVDFKEILGMLFIFIIFTTWIWLRNKIWIWIKNYFLKKDKIPTLLNLIGGYVGDIVDYGITLILVYYLFLIHFQQLGLFGKNALIIFVCITISNVFMLIVQWLKRMVKINRLLDIIFDIGVYFPFLLPFLIEKRWNIGCIPLIFIGIVIIRKLSIPFMQGYVGDVVIYTDKEFEKVREDIKKKISQRIEMIISKDIDDIYVIGHSLGSVIGYDVLYDILVNKEINMEKIKAYFTVGSPLDKIAYLFRKEKKTKGKKAPGLDDINWYNFYELLDLVGANLNFYEHPIKNILSNKFWYNPLSAHISYWQVPKVMNKMIDIMDI